jgi:HK97 family phage major capsid protein
MKTSKQYKEERGLKLEALQKLVDAATAEKRELTDTEKEQRDQLNAEIDGIDKDIRMSEMTEKRLLEGAGAYINKSNADAEKKEMKQFSFLRFLRGAAKGQLEGFEAEMHQEALKEARNANVTLTGFGIPSIIPGLQKRDLLATTGQNGAYLVPTETTGFIDALTAKMVLVGLGASYLNGLTGNVSIPKISTASSAAWEGEVDAGAETQPTIGALTLSPKRLGAYAQISKQLMAQTSYGAENIARMDIERAIRLAVESAAISGASGSTNPTGILATSGIGSVAIGATGGAPTWAMVTSLEKEVAIDNADLGSLGYLTNPKVRNKLKQTAVVSSTDSRMIWGLNDNTLNGYQTAVTTQVPSTLDKSTTTGVCSALIFGNFNDLIIANWAGLDVVVDPYTDAKTAQVNLIINSWWDVGVRNAESFAACLDITTT